MVVISWRLCRSVRRLNWVTRNELLHLCLQRRLRHLCKGAPCHAMLLIRYCRQCAVLSVAVPGWMPVGSLEHVSCSAAAITCACRPWRKGNLFT